MRCFIRLASVAVGILLPVLGDAATDGTLGPSSTGSKGISIAIPAIIRVSGMNDFIFSNYSGSGSFEISDSIVIGGNFSSGGGTYRVTVLGSGRQNSFTVERTTVPRQELQYAVFYSPTASSSGSTQISKGVPLTNQSGAHNNLSSTTPNASLTVRFSESVLQQAPAGFYTGTLSVVVEPE